MTDADTSASLHEALREGRPSDLLTAEAARGCRERLAGIEELITEVLVRMFSGNELISITHKSRGTAIDAVTFAGLSGGSRSFLDAHFDLAKQESRGAWYLPQEASLRAGTCNLASYVLGGNPFAVNAARDGNVKVSLRSPDAFAIWALALPLAQELLAPIEIRTATGKLKSADHQQKIWAPVAETYRVLGLDLDGLVEQMTYGTGWTELPMAGQRERFAAVVRAIAEQITTETAALWRAHTTQQLGQAFLKKAKKETPLARTVLKKALQPAFSTVFAGDWLAFLDYLGAEPNPAEEITTALPEPRIYVGASSKAGEVAAEQGVPVDEVHRIIASFLGQSEAASPVDERVAVMKRWWTEYEAVWEQQRPGMPSLWGLVDEGLFVLDNPRAPEPYLYRRMLTPDLRATIDRLWDGMTLTRWPERIVSEFHPHRQMADAFGPAAKFWQGVALACWYVCEGPSSRTTLGALGQYHARDVAALRDAGYPIDPSFFDELAQAESRLGPPQNIEQQREVVTDGPVNVTMTIGIGTRRDGFEILADIVNRYRRSWASQHLDAYLQDRWDTELRGVAREHSRRVAARGKPPTIKQFASFAAPAANHWFCGDLGALYAALGEAAPASPERIDLLPGDPYTFVRAVWTALGGQHLPEEDSWKDRPAHERQWQIGKLASQSLYYLQLAEALGRAPTPKEFKADRITWDSFGGPDEGWAHYVRVIERARTQPAELPPPPRAPAPPPPAAATRPPPSPPSARPAPPPPDGGRKRSGWRRLLGGG